MIQRRLPFDSRISRFDEWRGLVGQLLPRPIVHTPLPEGEAWIVGGEPPQVLIRLFPHTLAVYAFVPGGSGPRGAALRDNRIGSVPWAALPREQALNLTKELVGLARESAHREHWVCGGCLKEVPPEDIEDSDVCPACGKEGFIESACSRRQASVRVAAANVGHGRSTLKGRTNRMP